jgi:hypothetical protein
MMHAAHMRAFLSPQLRCGRCLSPCECLVAGQPGAVRGPHDLERGRAPATVPLKTQHRPARYFKSSPEVTRLAAMSFVRFPLSLRKVEDLPHARGIEASHETVRT